MQAQKNAENYVQRVEALDKTIGNVNPQVIEFDQDLVKRLISSIKVHKGMKLEIQVPLRNCGEPISGLL